MVVVVLKGWLLLTVYERIKDHIKIMDLSDVFCYAREMKALVLKYGLYVAWAIALISFAGSVYFAEGMGIPRCLLCWWQDIFMYPLTLIMGVGILRKDKGVPLYVLPLSLIGAGIAFYHNLLAWHIISESLAPCTLGVSCVTQDFVAFHFITIPLLSLTAFLVITALMFIYRAGTNNHD